MKEGELWEGKEMEEMNVCWVLQIVGEEVSKCGKPQGLGIVPWDVLESGDRCVQHISQEMHTGEFIECRHVDTVPPLCLSWLGERGRGERDRGLEQGTGGPLLGSRDVGVGCTTISSSPSIS